MHDAVPVYEDLPGWETDLSEVRERNDLPPTALDYLQFIEDQVGVPITLVGVGPGRKQFVHHRTLR